MSLPLEQIDGFTPKQRESLADQWILTLENLEAAVMAFPEGEPRARFLAGTGWAGVWERSIPRNHIAAPQTKGPRPGLGLRIPPHVASRLAPGRRTAATEGRPMTRGGLRPLPSRVSLVDRFPAVRDQGPRGTCVAFATAALREFADPEGRRFSEQFLYWGCKELDGDEQEGTTLAQATTVLDRFGSCLDLSWPYSPARIPGNEAHAPPPPEAIRSGRDLRLPGCPLLNSQDVRTLKEALAGTGGTDGHPVVIGVAIFASAWDSSRAHRSGEISLPFASETPRGGHAMCAVGYQDDPTVPGGGFLIVRNSWGSGWAAESRVAPGHALIPYAYISRFCFEAFTAPGTRSRLAADPTPEPEADPFAPFLDQRGPENAPVDRREWLDYSDTVPRGIAHLAREPVQVIRHAVRPREFRIDTPTNREEFHRRWCGWSSSGANEVARLAIRNLPPGDQRRLASARAGRERHLKALETNLTKAVGSPFPLAHEPRLSRLVPFDWTPRIQSVRKLADLTEGWIDRWEASHRNPDTEAWPDVVRDHLRSTTGLVLYELQGPTSPVRVLVGWFSPLTYSMNAGRTALRFVPPDVLVSRCAHEALEAWGTADGPGPYMFCSFGFDDVAGPLADVLQPVESSRHWELCWTHRVRSGTTTPALVVALPDRFSASPSLRNFSDLLVPVTSEQRVSEVKQIVDLMREDFDGNLTVDAVQRRTSERHVTPAGEHHGCRKSVVLRAFLALQENAPDQYRVEKHSKGDDLTRGDGSIARVRMVRPEEQRGSRVTSASRRPFRQIALGHLDLAVSGGVTLAANQWKEELHLTGLQALFLFLPLSYLGRLITRWLNRRAEPAED